MPAAAATGQTQPSSYLPAHANALTSQLHEPLANQPQPRAMTKANRAPQTFVIFTISKTFINHIWHIFGAIARQLRGLLPVVDAAGQAPKEHDQ